jgi:hypothetical protein
MAMKPPKLLTKEQHDQVVAQLKGVSPEIREMLKDSVAHAGLWLTTLAESLNINPEKTSVRMTNEDTGESKKLNLLDIFEHMASMTDAIEGKEYAPAKYIDASEKIRAKEATKH